MLITLSYVAATLLALLPFTLMLRQYVKGVELEYVMQEMDALAQKLKKISPEKEKKYRAIKAK